MDDEKVRRVGEDTAKVQGLIYVYSDETFGIDEVMLYDLPDRVQAD